MGTKILANITTRDGHQESFVLQDRVNNGNGQLVYHLQNQVCGDVYIVVTQKQPDTALCGISLSDGISIELRLVHDGAEQPEIRPDLLKSESMEQGQIQEKMRTSNNH